MIYAMSYTAESFNLMGCRAGEKANHRANPAKSLAENKITAEPISGLIGPIESLTLPDSEEYDIVENRLVLVKL